MTRLHLANGTGLRDGTATPQVSPIATGTTQVVLKWPEEACRLFVYPLDEDCELWEISGGATGGKFPIPKLEAFAIAGGPGDSTFIGRPNGTTRVAFLFARLK